MHEASDDHPRLLQESPGSEAGPGADARLLHALHELSASAGRAMDPGKLVTLAAQRACELLHGDAVALYVWDQSVELLVPVYANDPRAPRDDHPLRLGQGAAGQAVERREAVVVTNYMNWEHAVPWAVARNLHTVEAAPLLVADRAIGALVVRFYTPHDVSAEEKQILALLAAQVAPALEAARLYAASTVEREHERVLREITQALAANLDERIVLDLAVDYGARLLDAPYARVWLIASNGELTCAAAQGFIHDETYKRRLAADSASGRAARQQIVNLEDAPHHESWYFNREFGERTGLGAYLGAGLWRAGESLGVLEVMRQTRRRFSPSEEQLLVSLANAVAVAVSNARTHAAAERLAEEAEQRAAAVAESEVLLRSVYEAIGSGVLVFNGEGVVINANAAAEEILGRRVQMLIGMRATDFQPSVHEDLRPIPVSERPVSRALRSRQAVRKLVLRISRPDGLQRWLQVDAVPLLGADGSVTQVVASFIDISERKHSEEALRRRDAILESVASAASRLLTASDWEQGVEGVLRQLGAATGVSRVYVVPGYPESRAQRHEWAAEGVPPRADTAGREPYLRAIGLPRWESILREGGIIQGPLHTFPPDEQSVLEELGVCSTVVVPIFAGQLWWGFIAFDDCREERDWPGGAVEVLRTAAGTLGAAIERRRSDAERLQLVREQSARAEAESAQRRQTFLAEASHILASSLDYETTLQSLVNLVVPTLADYCSIDIREPEGSTRRLAQAPIDLVEPWVLADEPRHVGEILRSGEAQLFPRLSGLDRPPARADGVDGAFASGLMVPVLTRAGTDGVLTCLARPGRRPFDTRDLNLAEDIARRCAMAIDNARLYREARDAIGVRDEFLSVAAHELKTPMTSLRGYAQLLGREFDKDGAPNPDRARRAALTIQVQADKLARLVGQLLDISRIQSGRLALERKPTDISRLVRDVIDSARTQLKQHSLMARLPSELTLTIDPLRVEQVVTNLLDNAIKYSPDGGQIDITLSDDAESGQVRLAIRDRGVGVPLEHRAHIFDRFYQAHAGGPLTSMAGMGLGLYISRQIVELHGGHIAAEFPDDRGTRFVVTLPQL
jgi:PAS domain S-box-containing protein